VFSDFDGSEGTPPANIPPPPPPLGLEDSCGPLLSTVDAFFNFPFLNPSIEPNKSFLPPVAFGGILPGGGGPGAGGGGGGIIDELFYT